MKKRYIDFVPAKNKKAPNGARTGVRSIKVTSVSEPTEPAKKPAPKKKTIKKPPVNPLMEELEVEEIFAEREVPAGVSKGRKGSKYGVVEDYQPRFVRAEVKKRPLGHQKEKKLDATKSVKPVAKFSPAKSPAKLSPAKSVAKQTVKTAVKPAAKPTTGAAVGVAVGVNSRPLPKRPMGVKTAFVNTNKVQKRPLSKSAYVKKPVVVPEEKPTKPVKIIEKPERDSKAGLIIAIILTIIMGAAAGTVAFLLLPK